MSENWDIIFNEHNLPSAASPEELKMILDHFAAKYNHLDFIAADPISLPHSFESQKDQEIIGFWIAMLSWGQRKTILDKGVELVQLLENEPFNFINSLSRKDITTFSNFKHRTFNYEDTQYFLRTLQRLYRDYESMGALVTGLYEAHDYNLELTLIAWHHWFFDDAAAPSRTRKHVSTPATGSACKRLNMFLRWMVRPNVSGVDLGLWPNIKTASLVIPLDVHVGRIARQLGVLQRPQNDWRAAQELTTALLKFDPVDPVRYDFALFGLGLASKTTPLHG